MQSFRRNLFGGDILGKSEKELLGIKTERHRTRGTRCGVGNINATLRPCLIYKSTDRHLGPISNPIGQPISDLFIFLEIN